MSTVLVIEDNPTNLDLVQYLLHTLAHQVLVAIDGPAGLKIAREHLPNLVLCDVQLPGMDGYELVRQLKQDPATTHLTVYAVTALAMVGDREAALRAGFDGYIAKPIIPEEFMRLIASILPDSHTPGASTPGPTGRPTTATTNSGPTVLVVDDNDANLYLLSIWLGRAGFRFLEARTVQEALAMAQKHRPAIIVSDLHLGLESGHTLVSEIRAHPFLSKTPVLLTSATEAEDPGPDSSKVLLRDEPERVIAAIRQLLSEG